MRKLNLISNLLLILLILYFDISILRAAIEYFYVTFLNRIYTIEWWSHSVIYIIFFFFFVLHIVLIYHSIRYFIKTGNKLKRLTSIIFLNGLLFLYIPVYSTDLIKIFEIRYILMVLYILALSFSLTFMLYHYIKFPVAKNRIKPIYLSLNYIVVGIIFYLIFFVTYVVDYWDSTFFIDFFKINDNFGDGRLLMFFIGLIFIMVPILLMNASILQSHGYDLYNTIKVLTLLILIFSGFNILLRIPGLFYHGSISTFILYFVLFIFTGYLTIIYTKKQSI